MKKFLLLFFISCFAISSMAQKKTTEKAPTQKEMQDMMKQAQGMMDEMMKEMSPEDKKFMDSMGMKMPDFNKASKNISQVSDGKLADAWDKENRIVFPRNAAKIAAIPAPVSGSAMGGYVKTIQGKTGSLLKPAAKTMGEKIYNKLSAAGNTPTMIGTAAAALWMMGKTQIAFVVMGKACAAAPTSTDNIGNYAAMLSMMGAPELALPILNNLNNRFPKNSTILNNIGQAWFGMGDMAKAEKYLDSTIRIFGGHPQANVTKALIEENRGKKPEAISALKKSIKQAYSDDKKNKLAQMGQKLGSYDTRMPGKTKNDPLNLGGFRPPPFPKSVLECATMKVQWSDYKAQIDQEGKGLEALIKTQENTVLKSHEQKTKNAVAMVNAAMANPGSVSGPLIDVPIYAERAGKKMTEDQANYMRKIEALAKKMKAWHEGEGKKVRDDYDKEMEKLSIEDSEQSGEGKPNRDFCPQYRDASDKFLRVWNAKKEEFYKEHLEITKMNVNEQAYLAMYALWPENFEHHKSVLKAQWLDALKPDAMFDFESITDYVCKKPELKPGMQLQKFDDVACQYHSTFWTPMGSMQMDCSNWTTKLGVGVLSLELKQDMDYETFGDQFQSCTVELGPKIGKEVEVGPLTVGAEAGVGVGVEIDRNGVKDVFVTAGAEAGASIGDPISISGGGEGRVSLVSGTAAVNGTGIFEGVK